MDEQLKQIGERLKGLRDALGLSVQEVADTCGIDVEKYEKIEQGELDITISKLMKIAHQYGVSAEELMFAETPHMKSYFVVRKGQGMSVERSKAYKYQSLVSGFVDHHADVFVVTVEPKPVAAPSTRTLMQGKSSISCSKDLWTSILRARPSVSTRATVSTLIPASPMVCWLWARRP